MKYKNTVQQAREKYLKLKRLSAEEQSIIDKDFRGKDYSYFRSLEESEFLLPEQYSTEATFSRIERQLGTGNPRKSILKYAAAVVLLITTTFSLYYWNFGQPNMVVISTSYGEKKQIELPDGSKVVLNSLSSVSYPKKMKGNTREVVLEGEALFDVVKDDRKTFIVKAQDIEVKVLGTQFNVLAYADDEEIITSLYEGAVVVSLCSGETFRLQPGEKAIYNKQLKSVDIDSLEEDGQSWKDGSLYFNYKPLKEIWKILERERGITFEVSGQVNNELKIKANFSRDDSTEDILDILGQTGGFTFERVGDLFMISPF